MSCVITCATDGSHDDKFTRLKGSKLCQEGRKLLTEQFQLINNEEPNPIVIDEADLDSANPEILTVEDDDKDGLKAFKTNNSNLLKLQANICTS